MVKGVTKFSRVIAGLDAHIAAHVRARRERPPSLTVSAKVYDLLDQEADRMARFSAFSEPPVVRTAGGLKFRGLPVKLHSGVS